ncbi:chaplin [Streptomyces sp. H27-C3]|uniref:chaplin n=1 Tax=Streptomyces sp. H27-C3 TaxID=3046305 RepID=UPI0024B8C3F3|nr:chaplin [Streptomyces sp. H27-C3]MDJ0466663.1 chaplin [Streptomyces sp. H27-C3]
MFGAHQRPSWDERATITGARSGAPTPTPRENHASAHRDRRDRSDRHGPVRPHRHRPRRRRPRRQRPGRGHQLPGVLSGNLAHVPLDVPVNACGITLDVVGVPNSASGNTCS